MHRIVLWTAILRCLLYDIVIHRLLTSTVVMSYIFYRECFFPFSRVLVFFMHDVDFYYINGLQNFLLSGPDIVATFI